MSPHHTPFVPTDAAVEDVQALLNLNQWVIDFFRSAHSAVLPHCAGTFLADDLATISALPTLEDRVCPLPFREMMCWWIALRWLSPIFWQTMV